MCKMTKTGFRKALAQADCYKPFCYTEKSQSGHEYKYCFMKSREGYTLRNKTTGNTVFCGYNRKLAEEIMVY